MKTCKVEGCNNKHRCKGYCNKHYKQYMKYGEIPKRNQKTKNEIVVYDDYAEIILYDKDCNERCRTLIDIDDIDKVKHIKWSINNKYYVGSNAPKVKLHRLIMNCPDDMIVDHINHNRLDNRKSNLRICTVRENNFNKKSKGVYWHESRNKWSARIQVDGKKIFLGYFINKDDAIQARRNAEIEYFGEYRNEYED